MLFNKEKYKSLKVLERAISHYPGFLQRREKIGKYFNPEETLLAEILQKEEILFLDSINAKYADLGISKWSQLEKQGILDCKGMEDSYDMFKFVGSCKPWVLSILNPDKRIFLKKVFKISHQYKVNLIGANAIHLYPVKNTLDECLSISLSEECSIKQYYSYNLALGNSTF